MRFDSRRLLVTLGSLVSLALVAGCGGGGSDDASFDGTDAGGGGAGSDGAAGAGGQAGTGGMAGQGGQGGSSACQAPGDCDDGVACTIDACNAGTCTHAPGSCPAGQFCDAKKGCIQGIVCASDATCAQQLVGDACKVNVHCDQALAVCRWDDLDADKDGHSPGVCGGDDCNDADPSIFTGHPEMCDGKDNDCNGPVDDAATCPGLGVCQAGQCTCPAANQCGGQCVDKSTDANNCGACGNKCPSAATCSGGTCVCAANAKVCGGACVDTKTDPQNCGACGSACAAGYSCAGSQCTCLKTPCGGACIDTKTDPQNCGACGKACSIGQSCQSGQCTGSTCKQPALFVLLDQSGSMTTALPNSQTRWQAATTGIQAFTNEGASSGLVVGLGYFGVTASGSPPSSCTTDADCGAFGPCFINVCLGASGSDSCTVADYAKAEVAMAALPGNASAFSTSLAAHSATTGTPTTPALKGAIQYVQSWLGSHPQNKAAVVLVTDGVPNECPPDDNASALAQAAQAGASGTPAVKTYVLGLAEGSTDLPAASADQVAAGGGTTKSYAVNSSADVQSALDTIRAQLAACP